MNGLKHLAAVRGRRPLPIHILAITIASSLLTLSATPADATLVLSPAVATFTGFNNGGLTTAAVEAVTGVTSLALVYKQNVGGNEEGTFAGSYQTVFGPTLQDASTALITFDGAPDPFISGSRIFLYVKDGTPRPYYIFDISSWNGREALQLTSFYTGPGSISQISIFRALGAPPPLVPDGGSTVAFLGCAVTALEYFRRKLA